jgi:dynactin complex subunit
MGKNNGTHNGKEYFKAKPNHGIFLKPTSIALMDGTPVVPPAKVVPTSNNLSKDLEEAMKTNEKTE